MASIIFQLKKDVIERLATKFPDGFSFLEADIRNIECLDKIFSENKDIKYFFHFAALKNIPESQLKPQLYRIIMGGNKKFNQL